MVPAQLDVLLWHIRKLAAGPYLSQQTDQQLLDDFAVHRDDSAFAALVSRHGSMVLRVCRRVLCHEQDAEDAFQATFLVLARNSASIRKRAALAPWLHGVAYRIAMKAKRSAARRRTHETRRGVLTPRLVPNPTWDDVQVVLDEEIERLPERFRTAFVLCILEGKSRPEAAAELGIKEGTVSSRLSRARQRLQQQLGRRGIELSALLAALSVAENASRAVPAALVRTTLRWGLLVAAGGTAVEMIPTHVAILATGVTKAMFLTKAKIATAMLLTLTLMAGGVGVLTHQVRAGKPVAPQEIKSPGNAAPQLATQRESATPRATAASKEEAEDSIRFSGRVVDPQGRPVEDAKLYLAEASPNKRSIALRTTSDADGRYRFLIRKSEFEKSYSQEPWKFALVVALAENFGLGISRVSVDKPPVREDAIIQLVKDDVPITGRLIDLQGKPIAGVQIHVRGIQFPRDRDLTTFIDALKTKKEGERPQQELLAGFLNNLRDWNLDAMFPPVTTDAGGRFSLTGIGRERLADLLIEGPTIETNYIYAMTRPCETIKVPAQDTAAAQPFLRASQPLYIHYGAAFDHVVAPSKPVVGVVRDGDTGKPIVGAVVENSHALPMAQPRAMDYRIRFRAVTDDHGRYRITGMPRSDRNELRASPPAGQPYVASAKEVPSGPGLDPVTVDFALKRGVWINVHVTDKVTGKPVRCRIQYFAFVDNPYLQQAAGFATPSSAEQLSADGNFRLVGLPGRGLIAVQAGIGSNDGYLPGIGADRIPGRNGNAPFQTTPYLCFPEHFHGVAEVNPAKDAESVSCHLVLDPGRMATGTIVGPDGKPLAGAIMTGLGQIRFWIPEPLKNAQFTVKAPKPGETQRLLFLHKDKGLAGTTLLRGGDKGPLTVKLEPWGVVTGRLLNADGKPQTDVQIVSQDFQTVTPEGVKPQPLDAGSLPFQIQPDRDGRFRIEGLVPGLKYHLDVMKGIYPAWKLGFSNLNVAVQSGEIKDLGDIRAKPADE